MSMNSSPVELQIHPGDLKFFPPDMASKIETAARHSLTDRWYADPHSGAFIRVSNIESIPDAGSYRVTVDVVVTIYPTAEQMRQHFGGSWSEIVREPQPRDCTHTIEVYL